MSKADKLKRRKKLADIAKIGTIALGALGSDSFGGDGLLAIPTLNLGKVKAGVQVDASARQSARMVNAPQGPSARKAFDRPRDSYVEGEFDEELDWKDV